MAFSLPFTFELPQVGFYDFFVGIALFCVFAIVLMLGFLARGAIKWLIFCLCLVLFFALPFFNLLIVDSFINKVAFTDNGSKKLVYIDSYFLNGTLQNVGKNNLKKCHFNLYVKNAFPRGPEYRIIVSDLDLKVGAEAQIERSVDNFKADGVREIKIRCF